MKNSKSEYNYLNKQNEKALRAANQMDEVHSERMLGGCMLLVGFVIACIIGIYLLKHYKILGG